MHFPLPRGQSDPTRLLPFRDRYNTSVAHLHASKRCDRRCSQVINVGSSRRCMAIDDTDKNPGRQILPQSSGEIVRRVGNFGDEEEIENCKERVVKADQKGECRLSGKA